MILSFFSSLKFTAVTFSMQAFLVIQKIENFTTCLVIMIEKSLVLQVITAARFFLLKHFNNKDNIFYFLFLWAISSLNDC